MHRKAPVGSVLNHIGFQVVDYISWIEIPGNSQSYFNFDTQICGYTRSWAASTKSFSMASSKGFFWPRFTSHAPQENKIMKQSMWLRMIAACNGAQFSSLNSLICTFGQS
jgi:hypothetical protein